jgi:hypothetical protein
MNLTLLRKSETMASGEAPSLWRVALDTTVIALLFASMYSTRAMFLAVAASALALVLYATLVMGGPAGKRLVILGIAAAIAGAVFAVVIALQL